MRTLPVLAAALAAVGLLACRSSDTPATPTASPTATQATPAATPTTPPPGQTAPASPTAAVAEDAPATAACAFSTEHADVANWRALVQADDAAFGPADAAVTVIEFYEPNCPHCAHFAPTLAMVERAHPNVRFVYKPVVFWPISTVQAQALYAATRANKFHAMNDALFARTTGGSGLTEAQVREAATQAGMNADQLMTQVNAGQYRAKMLGNRTDFQATGLNTVPAVIINGKVVGSERNTGCLSQLIRQQAGG